MVDHGYDVSVYCSSEHPSKTKLYKGVHRICKKDPEKRLGTFGQFVYDLHCILDARKRNFDIILQLGYTSSSIWHWLLPKRSFIVTNMDGMEFHRTKYGKLTRIFLQYAEYLVVRHSNYLITDAIGMQNYLIKKYKVNSTYIAYGAIIPENFHEKLIEKYGLKKFGYYLIIARFEPENNIEMIIKGFMLSNSEIPLVIVGNTHTPYGKMLTQTYHHRLVIFAGYIFNDHTLNSLRYFSLAYFHGHSVGGTNPSLLEAMASQAFICANDNIFNREVLGRNAYYFKNKEDVCSFLKKVSDKTLFQEMVDSNLETLKVRYNWKLIVISYELLFMNILYKKSSLQHSKENIQLLPRKESYVKAYIPK